MSRGVLKERRAPAKFLDAEKAVLEGAETGLATARAGNLYEYVAGNLYEYVAGAFFAVLKKYGIVKDNRAGHAIGLS